MHTVSENIVTKINESIFYKEFTFDKNDFYPKDGKKELADNILWIDDLLFVIQIKERNTKKSKIDVNNWFNNKVIKKAKSQIYKTIEYFRKYDKIPIKNCRNQQIDISKASLNGINKIIIYKTEEELNQNNKNKKFYESSKEGNFHIFNVEDYYWVSKYLITPAEFDEYLKFRERIYLKHKDIITAFPEQYILGHFFNTDDETEIKENYIETFNKIKVDYDKFDISGIIESFLDKIRIKEQRKTTDYKYIISEIAKLKREELFEFKTRIAKIIELAKTNIFSLPYRFVATRTGCGFVFLSLDSEKSKFWERAIINFTEIYKYKHRLEKCLGVVVFKKDDYFDMNWVLFKDDWKYDKELADLVKKENELYGESEIKTPVRYNIIDK